MNFRSCSELPSTSSLSTGCPIIDSVTGGIKTGIITEIAGEAGCGKTQICLTLALQSQLPIALGGLNGQVAYMSCGEGEFPIRRLQQLATEMEGRVKAMPISPSTSSSTPAPAATATTADLPSATSFLAGVHIEQCYTSDSALESLNKLIPDMCRTRNVRLLILDSIGGLVRTEFDMEDKEDTIARTDILFRISRALKWLAGTFGLAVVVVNQVKASNVQGERPRLHLTDASSSTTPDVGLGTAAAWRFVPEVSPALGEVWNACINTRIMLSKDPRAVSSRMGRDKGREGGGGYGRGVTDVIGSGSGGDESHASMNPNPNPNPNTYPSDEQGQAQRVEKEGTPPQHGPGQGQGQGHGSLRRMWLEFSPTQRLSSCSYEIKGGGVFGLPGSVGTGS